MDFTKDRKDFLGYFRANVEN